LTNKIAKSVKEEIDKTLTWMQEQKIDDKQIQVFVKEILSSPKTFVIGAGRSSLVARAFAMRLMHLGFQVHVISDTTTPAVEENDLFIVISGQGESKIFETRIAIDQKAKIACITSYPNSTLGRLADIKLIVSGRKKEEKKIINYEERRLRDIPIAPLGTLFELFCLVILDSVISHLVIEQKKTEEDLNKKHARPE
jgi:6-phospho 3-hexuloisomerase